MSTVQETFSQLTERFLAAGLTHPELSARWILEEVLHYKPHELTLHAETIIQSKNASRIEAYARRREKHEPLQYLFHASPFYGLELTQLDGVFIPRPETETLVEEMARQLPAHAQVREICTGTGAIAVALAHAREDICVIASDANKKAVQNARANIQKFHLEKRVKVSQADLLEEKVPEKPYDALIANPPYIPTSLREELPKEVLTYEDSQALFSGVDGLDHFRRIIEVAPAYVCSDGLVAFELGEYNVEQAAGELDHHFWHDIEVKSDATGRPRFLFVKRTEGL